ncbi:MAG TPA: cation-translocating P-type ATPase [Sediminibacterium sp.]|uniref:cation-translocating P-type ATPase n=1 Tax=Sediminibacterium sp. TaxID=1917865 RepID=UPI0008C7B138|nr:cation-translocating P-type ATPase [Sediminibacterium sp.]OHC86881.1 MAG: haloacid dehalogenase [Sphingobacteriia bacterium RIFOXYC2_FULL_35_18]OHC88261.1 MAG: haloacid dehalogenase [Sphingobacteriia bacterium RIFOXYD2_FULL_35_12]HLD51738.1 cation-translocating P-type ATPase [Sediminibacterium sp.]
MPIAPFNIEGLSDQEVLIARKQFGNNQLSFKQNNGFLDALKSIFKEPMVILLLVAASIYFITGNVGDGLFLAGAILLVAAISLYQDARSKQALQKLEEFTQPFCKVVRNKEIVSIHVDELVIGDYLLIEEGNSVSADGLIIQSNDFLVNESILTGETFAVSKSNNSNDNQIYRGTYAVAGLAIAQITAIGNDSKLGKIGKSLESIVEEKTPLEKQINRFVRNMAIIGAIVFLVVWFINFKINKDLLNSLLQALTLAMSILPEEIPVAFTTFMALGAWRLMKMGIVVKQMKTVETLGSATVICTDKTGTLTENKMSIAAIYNAATQKSFLPEQINLNEAENQPLIDIAMWASEPIPFDPMELTLHQLYKESNKIDERPLYKMIHEYPLEGRPPMMTHIFENAEGKKIIASKGAPEAILACSNANSETRIATQNAINEFTSAGYRVLAVGEALFSGNNFPAKQQDFLFELKGVIAFYDPPKENMALVLNQFYKAGIQVKIITGDNAATTTTIAKKIGFKGAEKQISGDELMLLSDNELKIKVAEINIFTRMFPEAKLKIINALKSNNDIVAMTGDGVNDGPALKAAHIGIAMGKKGTEIAKQAASLILIDDDLAKMVDAVAMGRKIYTNLKKAIQYIISIHIPIVLTVFIPLALGWLYPNIFTPVHVIFLELIMGPTCSIIYENEPMEKNTMAQSPRPFTSTFFSWKELTTSLAQGLAITAGTLYIYQYAVDILLDLNTTRTMVFSTLVFANIFLTLINRSFYYSIITTIGYKNNLVLGMIIITLLLLLSLIYIKPLAIFFDFSAISIQQLSICFAIGSISVLWYELVKLIKRWK